MPFGSSANPRRYKGISQGAHTMAYWQTQARTAVRDQLPRLPARMLKNLFRRLERWTWWRIIDGEQYFLLYRGVSEKEAEALSNAGVGSWVSFPTRTSYTVQSSVAWQFAAGYEGKFLGVWVPSKAIVTAPIMYGPNMLQSYDHTEMEIIVDPYAGQIQDLMGVQEWYGGGKDLFKYADENHPWQKMNDAALEKFNAEMDAGKIGARFRRHMNPTAYRPLRPTPDAHTRTYGLFG